MQEMPNKMDEANAEKEAEPMPHVPLETMEKDLADTEKEIAALKGQYPTENRDSGIRAREMFCERLKKTIEQKKAWLAKHG